jgi:two-component system, response regulator
MTGSEVVDILLVEDNPRDVELILRALKKHNLANRVTVVTDGEQALDFVFARGAYAERANTPHPKAIFLDLKLPKVGGIEVLQQIRSNERTRMLPVVVMTSSQEERDIVDAYKLGVNSYVVKPMDFDQFAKVVADLGYYWVAINKTPL